MLNVWYRGCFILHIENIFFSVTIGMLSPNLNLYYYFFVGCLEEKQNHYPKCGWKFENCFLLKELFWVGLWQFGVAGVNKYRYIPPLILIIFFISSKIICLIFFITLTKKFSLREVMQKSCVYLTIGGWLVTFKDHLTFTFLVDCKIKCLLMIML